MGKIARNLKQKIIEPLVRTDRRNMGNYRFDKTIAEGLYGKIKLAHHVPTGQKVVVKVIEKRKLDIPYHEADLLAQLRHKHIVRLLEVLETPEKQYIVCDFVEGGELYDYIMDKGHLDEDEARGMWRQLISAVDYMHRRNIVHRDLKLENVMLDNDKNLVLIDLGLGSFMTPGKTMKTFCGSVAYAAPEMFMSQLYSGQAVDVWSLGVTLYCMVMGYLPFEDPQRVIEADYIPLNESIDESGTFMRVSTDFVDLIDRIFQRDPQKRITVEEIMAHPWTNKGLTPMASPTVSSSIPLPIITGPRAIAPVKVTASPIFFVPKTLSMPMALRPSSSENCLDLPTSQQHQHSNANQSHLAVPLKRTHHQRNSLTVSVKTVQDALSSANIQCNPYGTELIVKPLAYYHCSATASSSTAPLRNQPHVHRLSNQFCGVCASSETWEQTVLNSHLIEKLTELGYDRNAIEASVNQCSYDPITASLYLFNKKSSQLAVEA